MKDKKFIIVKKIAKKEQYRSQELQHCKFVAIERASADAKPPQELDNEEAVGVALAKGWRVLAVCAVPVPVPFVVLDVKAKDENKHFNASGFITVRLTTGREFYDWASVILTENDEVLDTDFWEQLYCRYGIDDYFKHLVNSENVAQLEKHNIHATDFPDLDETLRKWFTFNTVDSFRIEDARDNPSAALLRCINAVNKAKRRKEEASDRIQERVKKGGEEIARTWLDKAIEALKNHPFKTILTIAAAIVVFNILRGGLASYSAAKAARDKIDFIEMTKRRKAAESTMPVKGALEVRADAAANPDAAALLVGVAEAFARDSVSKASGRTKSWANGAEIELPANKWAEIATAAQDFAANSDGEFSCELDGRSVVIAANASKVLSFVLDVSALSTDPTLVSEIAATFGISFSGKTVSDPKPIRKSTMAAAMEKIKAGRKITVECRDTLLAFRPNYEHLVKDVPGLQGLSSDEIIAKAKDFWANEAPEAFARFPREAKDFADRFLPLDRDLTEGFEDAEKTLSDLSKSLEQEAQNARLFLGKCDAPWLKFTAPADRPVKMRLVDEAARDMDRMKSRVDARWMAVRAAADAARLKSAYEGEIAAFKATAEEWWEGVAELITIYNRQVERKTALAALAAEIVAARERKDFSEAASYARRIEEAKSARLAAAKDETLVAQNAAPAFAFRFADSAFGPSWAKRMKKGYSAIPGAAAEIDSMAADFTDKAVNYFCPAGTRNRTLEKALQNALAYADAVRYNHDAKSTSDTEVALLAQCDTAFASFLRAQRRAAQK